MSPDPFLVEVLWPRLLFFAILAASAWYAGIALWYTRACWWRSHWRGALRTTSPPTSKPSGPPPCPMLAPTGFPPAPVTPRPAALTDAEIDAVCDWEDALAVVLESYAAGADRLTQGMTTGEIDVVIRATMAAERSAANRDANHDPE